MRSVIAAAALSAILLSGGAARAQETTELKYFVEVAVDKLDDARTLAADGFDIAGLDRKALLVGIVANTDDLARLEKLGWPVTIRSTNEDPHAIDALSDYTDPQELSAFMDSIVAAYPTLAKKIVTQNTLFEGQKQYAMLITKDVATANTRPSFILDAQHHAREVMTPEIARDMIDYLTSRYATDTQVQRWVDSINIYIVGSVNPDGGMYVFTTDPNWRRNRRPSCPVDDNRNYPALWGSCNGSTSSCTSDTNRGTAPGSEPESQGLMQLTASVRPFYSLSYHSYGEYLMYPYGCSDPDEKSALDEVAQALNAILPNDSGVTGLYATGPTWSTIYLADGTSNDTQYNQYGVNAFAIEVNSGSEGFQPDYATWRNITVQRQRIAWQYFLDKTLDGAQIRGSVTDAGTGLPLAATTSLQEVTFTHGEAARHADANGNYRMLVHSNGTYHPVFSMPGYCSAAPTVSVGTGPAVVDVSLGKPGVPPGPAAAASGDNAIDVSWQPAVSADQYRIYRSLTSGGPYAVVATVPGAQLAYHDTPVSGGVTYYYVVRAVQGCESGASAEVFASTTGACTVGPVFAGLSAVTNAGAATCELDLSWPGASPRCAGGITYSVYRSTSSPFTPGPASLIASGLSGTTYADHDALASAGTYHYVVRAVDASNNVDDGNAVDRAMTVTGPSTIGTWRDDAGDTQAPSMTTASPWSIQPTGGRTAPAVYATGTYSNNTCAALTTPAITLQTGSALSFASKYDLESNYDAGIVEVATGPSYASWTKVAVNYPDPLSFTGNACGIPTGGAGSVFSRTITAPAYPASPYSGSLGAYAGQSVKLRWRLSSDAGVVGKGWWVDDIAITNTVIPGACVSGGSPSVQEASPAGDMHASRGAGTSVDVTYAPACGSLDQAIYWGAGPFAGSAVWTNVACGLGSSGHALFDPGDPAADSFYYFVVVGQRAASEGSYGTATSGERPEASGFGACDKPQVLGGSCP